MLDFNQFFWYIFLWFICLHFVFETTIWIAAGTQSRVYSFCWLIDQPDMVGTGSDWYSYLKNKGKEQGPGWFLNMKIKGFHWWMLDEQKGNGIRHLHLSLGLFICLFTSHSPSTFTKFIPSGKAQGNMPKFRFSKKFSLMVHEYSNLSKYYCKLGRWLDIFDSWKFEPSFAPSACLARKFL